MLGTARSQLPDDVPEPDDVLGGAGPTAVTFPGSGGIGGKDDRHRFADTDGREVGVEGNGHRPGRGGHLIGEVAGRRRLPGGDTLGPDEDGGGEKHDLP